MEIGSQKLCNLVAIVNPKKNERLLIGYYIRSIRQTHTEEFCHPLQLRFACDLETRFSLINVGDTSRVLMTVAANIT